MENKAIVQRIKELIEYFELSIPEFAERTNIKSQNLYSILSGKRGAGEAVLNKILLSFDTVNRDWLFEGKGDKLKTLSIISDPDNKDIDIVNDGNNTPYIVTKSGIEYYKFGASKFMMKVPFVPVKAYAKYIDEQRDAIPYEGREFFYFPVDQIYHGNYQAFEIKGDSMDNDTKSSLANGDVVLGRELSRDLWKSPLHINDYANWIIVLENTIVCKQITKHDISTGEIVCHSLNSDPAYADFTINLQDVKNLFNIVMVTRFF